MITGARIMNKSVLSEGGKVNFVKEFWCSAKEIGEKCTSIQRIDKLERGGHRNKSLYYY